MRQTRRDLLKAGLLTGLGLLADAGLPLRAADPDPATPSYPSRHPAPGERRFVSEAVESTITGMKKRIADPEIAWLFENCFPNTLDTTVHYREVGGKPDTFVITGDIPAMWLRDSSAQVWPYLPLVRRDAKLHTLVQGVIHRQTQCLLLDPYANAFLEDPAAKSQWADDNTAMKPGVHEHKWEVDSLCYPIRLAYGYWQQTHDVSVFDAAWEQAMDRVVQTFREQQRKDGLGPYYFERGRPKVSPPPPEAYGSPVQPTGLICSRFRPSDDETTYQFLVPANFFAVTALHQMAELLGKVRHNPAKAARATALAEEVAAALRQHATQVHPALGAVYTYEMDGLGHRLLMDDANVPSLLALPYLGAVPVTDPVYQATRRLGWSKANPYYFEGKYAGIGSLHTAPDMIWPISLIIYGLTSQSASEAALCLRTLKATHAGTGFMHESFQKDDPRNFTRTGFAWANTLFGEFILHIAQRFPHLLSESG